MQFPRHRKFLLALAPLLVSLALWATAWLVLAGLQFLGVSTGSRQNALWPIGIFASSSALAYGVATLLFGGLRFGAPAVAITTGLSASAVTVALAVQNGVPHGATVALVLGVFFSGAAWLAIRCAPNSSLKRTDQSLRDWSCRLAQALGLGCFARSVCAACAALHLARQPFPPPRMPFSTAADHRFVCSSQAQARDSSQASARRLAVRL